MKKGSLVWVNFTPSSRHEQQGRRPAIVISATAFNLKTGFAFVVPITSKQKGFAAEYPLPPMPHGIEGVALVSHTRSIDIAARIKEVVGMAPQQVVDDLCGIMGAILEN